MPRKDREGRSLVTPNLATILQKESWRRPPFPIEPPAPALAHHRQDKHIEPERLRQAAVARLCPRLDIAENGHGRSRLGLGSVRPTTNLSLSLKLSFYFGRDLSPITVQSSSFPM